jgi:hypothetical protein
MVSISSVDGTASGFLRFMRATNRSSPSCNHWLPEHSLGASSNPATMMPRWPHAGGAWVAPYAFSPPIKLALPICSEMGEGSAKG